MTVSHDGHNGIPRRGFVSLIGAGPGDPGLLTVKAARRLRAADVLVYDALASAPIVALVSAHCERVYVGKRAKNHTVPQEEISQMLVRYASAGKTVARLKGGDPYIFGRGGEEAQILRAAGIAFEVIPGITSAIAVPAYAGISITHRDANTSFTIVTGHEDPTKTTSTLDWNRLADGNGTAVFLMAMGNLAHITSEFLTRGRSAATPVAVISDGTTPRQRTVVGTLATIADDVIREGIGAPAIVVIGEVVRFRKELQFFDIHPLFGKRVLITRPIDEAQDMVERMYELGAEPVHVPVFTRGPLADSGDTMRKAVVDLHARAFSNAPGMIVFSSAFGVRTFFADLKAAGLDSRALGRITVACVGDKTAESLAAHGVRADIVPNEYVGEELAHAILVFDNRMTEAHRAATGNGGPITLWGSAAARTTVADMLIAAGRTVERIAAYDVQTILDPTIAAAAANADVWTFASGSAVAGLLANLDDVRAASTGKIIACIGPVTAEAARAAGLHVDLVPEEYTADALLSALLEPVAR